MRRLLPSEVTFTAVSQLAHVHELVGGFTAMLDRHDATELQLKNGRRPCHGRENPPSRHSQLATCERSLPTSTCQGHFKKYADRQRHLRSACGRRPGRPGARPGGRQPPGSRWGASGGRAGYSLPASRTVWRWTRTS